jgi:hypothetical protein
VIRFSAALVAAAIGVLIGGIASSELLLVYIAIAVSAVALVVLAIGVLLKREELFGEGQGLAPAAAGVRPVQPAHAGESYGQSRPGAHVTPPPLQGAAAGPGVAFAAQSQATSAPTAAVPATALQPQATVAPPWATKPAAAPWSSSGAETRPAPWPAAAPSGAVGSSTGAVGSSVGAAGTRADWVSRDAGAAGSPAGDGGSSPRTWAAPPTAVYPARTQEAPPVPGTGSGPVPPSWFDRMGKSSEADATADSAAEDTVAGDTSTGDTFTGDTSTGDTPTGDTFTGDTWPWSGRGTPAPQDMGLESTGAENTGRQATSLPDADAATAADDEDDDWPTRYSWLDDEPDGSGPGEDAGDSDNQDTGAGDANAAGNADVTGEQPEEPTRADAATDAAPTLGALTGTDPDTPEPAATAETAAHADPVHGSLAGAKPVGTAAAKPPTAATETASDAGLVSVIRGVPRYHQSDCVLIRFMPEGDSQRLTVAEAKEAGCTPCGACEPPE